VDRTVATWLSTTPEAAGGGGYLLDRGEGADGSERRAYIRRSAVRAPAADAGTTAIGQAYSNNGTEPGAIAAHLAEALADLEADQTAPGLC
jgi:hypothetical protein